MSKPTVENMSNVELEKREKAAIDFIDEFLDWHLENYKIDFGVPMQAIIKFVSKAAPEIQNYIDSSGSDTERFLVTRGHLWKIMQHDSMIYDKFVQKVPSDTRRLIVSILKLILFHSTTYREMGIKLKKISVFVKKNFPTVQYHVGRLKEFLADYPRLFSIVQSAGKSKKLADSIVTANRAIVVDDVIVFTKMVAYGRIMKLVRAEKILLYAFFINDGEQEIMLYGGEEKMEIFKEFEWERMKALEQVFEITATANRNEPKDSWYYWKITRLVPIDRFGPPGGAVELNMDDAIIELDESNDAASEDGDEKPKEDGETAVRGSKNDPQPVRISKRDQNVAQASNNDQKSVESSESDEKSAEKDSKTLTGTGRLIRVDEDFGLIVIDGSMEVGKFSLEITKYLFSFNYLKTLLERGQRLGFNAVLRNDFRPHSRQQFKWKIVQIWLYDERDEAGMDELKKQMEKRKEVLQEFENVINVLRNELEENRVGVMESTGYIDELSSKRGWIKLDASTEKANFKYGTVGMTKTELEEAKKRFQRFGFHARLRQDYKPGGNQNYKWSVFKLWPIDGDGLESDTSPKDDRKFLVPESKRVLPAIEKKKPVAVKTARKSVQVVVAKKSMDPRAKVTIHEPMPVVMIPDNPGGEGPKRQYAIKSTVTVEPDSVMPLPKGIMEMELARLGINDSKRDLEDMRQAVIGLIKKGMSASNSNDQPAIPVKNDTEPSGGESEDEIEDFGATTEGPSSRFQSVTVCDNCSQTDDEY